MNDTDSYPWKYNIGGNIGSDYFLKYFATLSI